jgi:hypothetical protein
VRPLDTGLVRSLLLFLLLEMALRFFFFLKWPCVFGGVGQKKFQNSHRLFELIALEQDPGFLRKEIKVMKKWMQ